MTHLNDVKRDFLLSQLSKSEGQLTDLEQEWLESETSSTGPIADLWKKLYTDAGYNSLSTYLSSLGYTGSISKMMYDFFSANNSLLTGLVAAYHFTGDATDSTSNGYDLTNTAATLTADKDSVANQAYDFDGSTSLMSRTALSEIGEATDWTISCWINFDDVTTDQTVLYNTQASNNRIGLRVSSGLLRGGYYNTTWTGQRIAGSVSTATWYHVVFWSDAGVMNMKINNVAQADTSSSPYAPSGAAFGISPTPRFNGKLDEVFVWNRVLTADEITALYTNYDTALN